MAELLTPAMVVGTLTDLGSDLNPGLLLPVLVPAAFGSGGEDHATVARTPLVAATDFRDAVRFPAFFFADRPIDDDAVPEQSEPCEEFESSTGGAVVDWDTGCRLVGLLKLGDPPSGDSISTDKEFMLALFPIGADANLGYPGAGKTTLCILLRNPVPERFCVIATRSSS